MNTEQIDMLFLELSQFTTARTAEEIKLSNELAVAMRTVIRQRLALEAVRKLAGFLLDSQFGNEFKLIVDEADLDQNPKKRNKK